MSAVAPVDEEVRVTARDIALILNCSTEKVYRMARAGDIPAERLGRSWRFVRSAVLAAVSTDAHKPRFTQSRRSATRKRRL